MFTTDIDRHAHCIMGAYTVFLSRSRCTPLLTTLTAPQISHTHSFTPTYPTGHGSLGFVRRVWQVARRHAPGLCPLCQSGRAMDMRDASTGRDLPGDAGGLGGAGTGDAGGGGQGGKH